MSGTEPAPAFNKTEWGNIPLLTYLNYEIWKETMTIVLEAMDAYDIVTGQKHEQPQIDIDYHNWKLQAAKPKAKIHFSCSPAIQFVLKGL